MKNLLLFIAVILFACSEPDTTPKASARAEAGSGRVMSFTCEGRAFVNQVIGGVTNPYGTPITNHLYALAGSPNTSILTYIIVVHIQNNSSNTIEVFKGSTSKGTISPGASGGFTLNNSCACSFGSCPTSVDQFYTWTITRVSGSGSSQVSMTTTTSSPHSVSGQATLVFN